MKNTTSQSFQMQTELNQLVKSNIIMLLFSSIGYYSFSGENSSLVWIVLGAIYFLTGSFVVRSVKKAFQFYLLIYTYTLIIAAPLFDTSLRLIFAEIRSLEGLSLVAIVSGVIITLLGLWSQFQLMRSKLMVSTRQNIKSGRLNLENGFWNFDAPLHFDKLEAENKNLQRLNNLSKLSPLVTAFGFSIARSTEGQIQAMLFALCLYVLGYIVLWGGVKYLAISLQIIQWGKNNKITIIVENT